MTYKLSVATIEDNAINHTAKLKGLTIMPRPSEPLLSVMLDDSLDRYREAFEKRAMRGTYRVDGHDLKKAIGANELDLFATELMERITAMQEALTIVNELKGTGAQALDDQNKYQADIWRYGDWQRAVERFDPETDTIRAVAEEIAKNEAMTAYYAGKKKRDVCMWWNRADRIALVRGLERSAVEAQARAYLLANPIRYAVSTGRLTYLGR